MSLSPQLERDIAKVGEYHQNNEKRVPSWVCMPNKIGCHKERWFIVQRQDINLGMVDQRNGPEWTFDKTLPNWPSKRKQVIENAQKLALTIQDTCAFAICPGWGVQFYNNKCFDATGHLQDNKEWDTFVLHMNPAPIFIPPPPPVPDPLPPPPAPPPPAPPPPPPPAPPAPDMPAPATKPKGIHFKLEGDQLLVTGAGTTECNGVYNKTDRKTYTHENGRYKVWFGYGSWQLEAKFADTAKLYQMRGGSLAAGPAAGEWITKRGR